MVDKGTCMLEKCQKQDSRFIKFYQITYFLTQFAMIQNCMLFALDLGAEALV
jgi:hypothetical protein